MMRKTFRRAERLKSTKAIERLFGGKSPSFAQYPMRLVWLNNEEGDGYPIQVGFSVPKRRFKRAVQRNLIKRRMKEAYRNHKYRLYEGLGEDEYYNWMLLYVGKEEASYATMEAAMKRIIKRFLKYRQTDQA